MKTNTREEILELLRGLFVDRDLDNSWGTEEKADQILALIEKEKKEERERIGDWAKSCLNYKHPIQAFIAGLGELEKKEL